MRPVPVAELELLPIWKQCIRTWNTSAGVSTFTQLMLVFVFFFVANTVFSLRPAIGYYGNKRPPTRFFGEFLSYRWLNLCKNNNRSVWSIVRALNALGTMLSVFFYEAGASFNTPRLELTYKSLFPFWSSQKLNLELPRSGTNRLILQYDSSPFPYKATKIFFNVKCPNRIPY